MATSSNARPDVFTGLLFASVAILLVGTALMALRNMEHADEQFVSGGNGSASAGPFDLVRKP
ncbi:MAG: hypothetical protein CMJ30_02275 [Phycisphaerae bacterium]|jgi:hypothetical protein|nr:hypothetical protein [Phycisphaerae bacterium]